MPALAIAEALRERAPASSRCWSARCAGSRPASCRRATSATICCRPSRSTGAPGGRTCAGRSSRAGCCGRWAGCSRRNSPPPCSAPAATPRRRSSGGRPGTAIPTAIQEQNAYPGLATRWLSRRVRHVYLGLPEAGRCCASGRATEVFDTGNPIAPRRPSGGRRRSPAFGLDGTRPVVLVTGGSQGALAINRAVAGWLEAGRCGRHALLWVTGRGTHAEFARYHRPPRSRSSTFSIRWPTATRWPTWSSPAPGMITVAELCAWGLPSVLVPLPTAAADHQTHNARVLAEAGAAALLAQAELTPASLGGDAWPAARRRHPPRGDGARARWPGAGPMPPRT